VLAFVSEQDSSHAEIKIAAYAWLDQITETATGLTVFSGV
jgi:hypothetical protein